MKTDEDSGEADEPPEEPPSSECRAKSEREANEELLCARRHVLEDRAHRTELTIDRIDRWISSLEKERES